MMTERAYPLSPVEAVLKAWRKGLIYPENAVALGLYLSITAPSEKQSERALKTTLEIIAMTGMSEREVEAAKALALVKVEKD
jgi:hypothetical protein